MTDKSQKDCSLQLFLVTGINKNIIDCCLEANKVTCKFQYMVVELHGKSDSYLFSFPLFTTNSLSYDGCYIFFPGLFSFSFLLIYGCLGLAYWGLVLGLDFLGLGFLVDGVWACGVRPSGLFRVEALYINMEEKPWEKSLCDGCLVEHVASEIIGVHF